MNKEYIFALVIVVIVAAMIVLVATQLATGKLL